MKDSPGQCFRTLTESHAPLQILGTVNAYTAMLAEKANAKAIYLSGAGVANASHGLPDLGITNLCDVLEDARRITNATTLPLLVDVDTGFGNRFSIMRTVKLMEGAGVAAIHIEDQENMNKRCGHRPNKKVVSKEEMGDRIKAAVDARTDDTFVIMARTDALASEGLESALARMAYYIECGADMLFPEACIDLQTYQQITTHISTPVLANITEFGKTPLFTREALASVGVRLILYPLSAFRAMSAAAFAVYETILQRGTQKDVVSIMQSRDDLYGVLHYRDYEEQLDHHMENKNG